MSEFAQKRSIPDGETSRRVYPVQRKVAVGASHDPAEVEAERTADTVVRALAGLSRPTTPEHAGDVVGEQNRDAHASGCGCSTPEIRRRVSGPVGAEGGEMDAATEQDLRSAGGGGRAIEPETRSRLEETMGADLSGVRLHAGDRAERLNRSMSAEAFTHGRDIYFRDGLPDTNIRPGLHLLAHEVTHTVQQGTSPLAPVRRMSTKAGSLKGDITSLAGLNAVIKDLKLKGGEITLESIDNTGNVKGEVTSETVDTAISDVAFEITTKTLKSTIIAQIVNSMNHPKKVEEVDPKAARKEAAKRCASHDKGEYFGGTAKQPHVHNYGSTSHLKLAENDRYDFVVGGTLDATKLAEAREALAFHPWGFLLNSAVDKALIGHKIELDDYEDA